MKAEDHFETLLRRAYIAGKIHGQGNEEVDYRRFKVINKPKIDRVLSLLSNKESEEEKCIEILKAKLEEAASEARLKMLEDQKPTPYEMEDFILSLITKNTNK